jgi:alcohol dehydrogenase class IV
MTTLTAKWNFPTTVLFGPGRIRELPAVLKAAGIERPLFVTDPDLQSCQWSLPHSTSLIQQASNTRFFLM